MIRRLSGEDWTPPSSVTEHRRQTSRRLHKLANIVGLEDIVNRPLRYLGFSDACHLFDPSLAIKAGVHYGLFGGALMSLSEPAPDPEFVREVDRLEACGCFAMTEVGHGSDVAGIETIAQRMPDGYLLHSPRESAYKCWIGNASEATHAIVFAYEVPAPDGQDGQDVASFGVQAYLVRLRCPEGRLLPGIEIWDCGTKAGLHGVDNGVIRFDRVPLSRTSRLERYALLPEKSRLGKFASSLTGGRLVVASGALTIAERVLKASWQFCGQRRLFGKILLDFPLQRERLVPRAVMLLANRASLSEFLSSSGSGFPFDHATVSGLKAWLTWCGLDAAQVCREACGGHGYLQVGQLRNDLDVYCTFEGDNFLLLQHYVRGELRRQRTKRKLAYLAREFYRMMTFPPTEDSHLKGRANASMAALARALQYRRDWFACLTEVNEAAAALLILQEYRAFEKELKRDSDVSEELRGSLLRIYLGLFEGKYQKKDLDVAFPWVNASVLKFNTPFEIQMPLSVIGLAKF
ncbi:MAG: acyl-CoA dehydrogenase family protein [Sulfobacillus sp.]